MGSNDPAKSAMRDWAGEAGMVAVYPATRVPASQTDGLYTRRVTRRIHRPCSGMAQIAAWYQSLMRIVGFVTLVNAVAQAFRKMPALESQAPDHCCKQGHNQGSG